MKGTVMWMTWSIKGELDVLKIKDVWPLIRPVIHGTLKVHRGTLVLSIDRTRVWHRVLGRLHEVCIDSWYTYPLTYEVIRNITSSPWCITRTWSRNRFVIGVNSGDEVIRNRNLTVLDKSHLESGNYRLFQGVQGLGTMDWAEEKR